MGVNYADALSYVVTGPAEEAAAWVGREVTSRAPFAVNEAQIAYFCALVEDADENHWDAEAAATRYGTLISPPGMLMVWAFPLPWNPRRKPEQRAGAGAAGAGAGQHRLSHRNTDAPHAPYSPSTSTASVRGADCLI